MPELTCDYLVVGAGATAMAFVDELVHASKEITVGFMLHQHVYFIDLLHAHSSSHGHSNLICSRPCTVKG